MGSLDGSPSYVSIGEVRLKLAPLRDKQYAEMDAYVRGEYVRRSLANIPESLNPEDRRAWIEAAQMKSVTLCWASRLGAEILATPEGLGFVVYLAAKPYQPEITPERCTEILLSSPDEIPHVTKHLKQENDPNPTTPQTGLKQRRKQLKAKKRRKKG